MPTRSFPTKTLLMHVCLGAALVMSGCSSTSKIAQNAKGSVYLEEVMDWSFEASHPAVIDQLTIMKVVKGVYGDGSSRMSAGGSKPMRVFSDEDAEFLAPLLAQGLSKAKPEQLVGFRVSSSAGSGSEPTAGSIYVRQGLIHFTISKGAGSTTFAPESAARTEYAPSYAAGGMGGVTAHVIDLQALAKAPMPAAMPVAKTSQKTATILTADSAKTQQAPTASASLVDENQFQQREIDQLSKAKETIAKKDTEISVLRKESEWMKRELRERDEELKALKASVKQAPKKKRAEARPTR
ncbi:MAG TPA: hypothetical protein VLD60_05475 [Nitrospira sp.]|nr:hypothetical protein [Nitrospira sp.]